MRLLRHVLCLLICALSVQAQSIDWIQQIPQMPLGWQNPGALVVSEDALRGRLLTVGWKIGTTLRTTDNGKTWFGVYALGTDVVGKDAEMYVTPDGRYLYWGLTPWNQRVALVSTDGGIEWRTITKDERVFKDGSHRGFERLIFPAHIRAFDTSYTVPNLISHDFGISWRRFPPRILDSTISMPRELQVAPHVLYNERTMYWDRIDVRTDTQWTKTSVSARLHQLVEVDGGVVARRNGELHIYPSLMDTAMVYRTWTSEVTGETINLSISDIHWLNDSTAFAFDRSGWVFEIRPRTNTIRLIQPFGAPFTSPNIVVSSSTKLVHAVTHGNRCIAIYQNANSKPHGANKWQIVEFENGDVLRTNTCWARFADVVINGNYPITYLGSKGMYMFIMLPGNNRFREIVRSTNLGTTWEHIQNINVEELDPEYLPIIRSARVNNRTETVVHTAYEHLLETNSNGAVEIRQRLTDRSFFDYGQETIYGGNPSFYEDNNRLVLADRVLGILDIDSGYVVDTLLKRSVRFFRRITPTLLAAGKDSLWLSFNNGKEWVNVTAAIPQLEGKRRGVFSDVAMTSTGTLLCAVRGVDYQGGSTGNGVAAYGGIVRSTNYGDSWQWCTNLPANMQYINSIVRASDSMLLATAGTIVADSAEIRNGGRFSATIENSAILKSTDDGATWTLAATDVRTGMRSNFIDPGLLVLSNGNVLANLHSGAVLHSSNGGHSWSQLDIANLGQAVVHHLRAEHNGTVVASTSIGVGYLRVPSVTNVNEPGEQVPSTQPHVTYQPSGTLTVSDAPQGARLGIFSMDGRQVQSVQLNSSSHTIDVSPLVRGIYAVEIRAGAQVWRSSFVR